MWERGIEGRVRFWQPEALWGCFPKSFSLFWTCGQSYGQWQSPESKNTESEGLLDSFVQGHMATPKSASCACVCARLPMCVRVEIRGQHQTLVFNLPLCLRQAACCCMPQTSWPLSFQECPSLYFPCHHGNTGLQTCIIKSQRDKIYREIESEYKLSIGNGIVAEWNSIGKDPGRKGSGMPSGQGDFPVAVITHQEWEPAYPWEGDCRWEM